MDHPKIAAALMNLRPGIQCCVYQDPGEDARIEVFDDTVLPTNEEILTECQRMDENDEELAGYADCRKVRYPPITHQLDQLYWDGVNNTTNWADGISFIKNKFPKPE